MNKPLIIKDDREKTGWDFPEDNFFSGTLIKRVKFGDYTLEGLDNIFLERKNSTGEIGYNLITERFWALIENIKYHKYKYIIIEASFDDIINYPLNSQLKTPIWNHATKKWMVNVATKIKPQFLIDTLARLGVEFGISVIFAGNKLNAEKLAHSILKEIYKLETANVR